MDIQEVKKRRTHEQSTAHNNTDNLDNSNSPDKSNSPSKRVDAVQQDDKNDKEDSLEQLLEHHSNSINGKLWRGLHGSAGLHKSKHSTNQHATKNTRTVSTGYKQLDQQLHHGGWPLTTTTELGLSDAGIGELRLLMPALRELQQSLQNNIVWIAPPFMPFAPALAKEKIDVSRLTIVQTNSMQDTLWAAEQALLAQCCAAVLTWTGNYNLSTRELRRLQLAAEKTSTWNVLFRHSDCLKQSSASGLRMHLKSDSYSRLDIKILKQPQSWGGQHCSLSLQPHYENWQRLAVDLLPHHNKHQSPTLSPPINDSVSIDHHQATVTVLTSLATLKTVH